MARGSSPRGSSPCRVQCRRWRGSLIRSAGEGDPGSVTHNRRYEAHYDQLNAQRSLEAAGRRVPCTLPTRAYGPQPIEWARDRQHEVWVWVTWQEGPATKIPAVAAGWNDRVVIVEWEAPGGRRSNVVWRNAVTRWSAPARW